MGRSISISTTVAALLLLLLLLMGIARTERVNKSSSVGLFWSTAKEEGDLLRWKPEANDDLSDPTVQEEEDRHLDGGFSSLDGMLQWAIGHSDPAKLKEATLDIQRLSPEDLKQRQMEIKELMEKLNTPSDAKLMKIAIDDLNNLSVPLEDRRRALEELLILVEPIDNANEATKALYAISALIRHNLEGQELFYMEAGDMMLQNILSNSSIDIRLRRKSVFLLADLVECQLDSRKSKEPPFVSNHLLLKSVVDLMASADLDLQEKALYAVKKLLLLKSSDALVFKEVCGLDLALQRMREQLQQLIVEDKFKEYAQDMENLRREVEAIFLGELDNVRQQQILH
ncbi:hypothetical protein Sango_1725600 [Sesamum angolense]|uniref:Nucleotide exchange factor Fes1 domain-containing protein n=1 Tax=Sesamum angolense TaxID=2727404 RepID=A0AAE1WMB3_9LAMI|nr:hypothetical protein Sango_1725600 [Sesamum angolense]